VRPQNNRAAAAIVQGSIDEKLRGLENQAEEAKFKVDDL
jgi:hypothetical protein